MSGGTGEIPHHRSVLYQETISLLAPFSSGLYLDCTAGAGGHSNGILEASAPAGRVLALDLDPRAVALTSARLEVYGERAIVRQGSYLHSRDFLQELGWEAVDGILLDLGVSSMQLDEADRGFSFRQEGPLDMRFDPTSGPSAADLVNHLEERELADILWKYGEERFSRRIARKIVQARPLHSTTELADVVRSALGRTKEAQDPATRTFQALRIAVNNELEVIAEAIPQLIALLQPNARIAVIAFHSLEDRIIKQTFQRESRDCICPPEQPICTCGHRASIRIITPHPIEAGEQEKKENPRARSAKLRVAEKLTKMA